jgi:hypothetical protein
MATFALGDEFTVNQTSAYAGDSVSVAGHDDGRFLVVWRAVTEPFVDGDSRFSYDIIGRAFAGSSPLGGDVIVNTERRDGQFSPQVAARSDGSYVVAYRSGEENSLEGNFAATQIVGGDGAIIGPEQLGDDYSNYRNDPDVAVDPNDFAILVWGEEFNAATQLRNPDNSSASGEEPYGWGPGNQPDVAIAILDGFDRLLFWTGYESEDAANLPGSPVGLWAQRRTPDGLDYTAVFLAADALDPSARVLSNGDVAVTWAAPGSGGTDVYAAVITPDGAAVVAPFIVHSSVAGGQIRPELAVLDTGDIVMVWEDGLGDGSGSSIMARLFDGAGTAQGPAFVVNQGTAGDQQGPSVASIGDGRFVVTWEGVDGVKARLYDTDDLAPSPLFSRPGTLDLSPSANQLVASPAGANSIYVDLKALSGSDRVTGFGRNDVFLTTEPLFDGNGDGVIAFGAKGYLALDGPGPATDRVRFDGVNALRYLGQSEGLSVYADARVRTSGMIEGTLASETLMGDAGETQADRFLYDNALGASLGDDLITGFSMRDLLVTTTALNDADGDGLIGFGADRLLEIGNGDQLALRTSTGVAIRSLEFDGATARNGVTYYVYSLVGSDADVGDLFS